MNSENTKVYFAFLTGVISKETFNKCTDLAKSNRELS